MGLISFSSLVFPRVCQDFLFLERINSDSLILCLVHFVIACPDFYYFHLYANFIYDFFLLLEELLVHH